MEQIKYDVFISYSRKDYVDEHKNVIPGNEVSKIKEALTKAGISFWFDEEGIYSGEAFTEKIVTNIEASRIFVYLSTANANSSSWTSKEIATADEMKKFIIPVRIDHTPYNRKVLFRIADRSYIDYCVNPQKGLDELIASIQQYLEKIRAEIQRKEEEERLALEAARAKEEEERRKREEEERRLAEEQEKIIQDIKLACTKLNNEEIKIELDRKSLLLSAQKITDEERQEEVKEFISTSSPAQKELRAEIQASKDRIATLQTSLNDTVTEKDQLKQMIETLSQQLTEAKNEIAKKEVQTGHEASSDAAQVLPNEDLTFDFKWRHPVKSLSEMWKKIKETMALRHWIVNSVLWISIISAVLAFIIFSFGYIETAPSYCALFGLTAYALVQLLLNKRAGVGFFLIIPFLVSFLAFFDYLYLYSGLYIYTSYYWGAVDDLQEMIFALPLLSVIIGIIVLPFLLIRKGGKSARSLLEGKRTHALQINNHPVFYLLFLFLLFITLLYFKYR